MKYTALSNLDGELGFSPLRDCTNRGNRRKAVRKRKRKSMNQLEVLSQEFQQHPEWDKQHISRIMKKTGLTEAQIYKWGWDQKKKVNFQEKGRKKANCTLDELFRVLPEAKGVVDRGHSREIGGFGCYEALLPMAVDFHFYKLQKSYKEMSEEFKLDSSYRKNLTCVFESFITSEG